MRQQMRQLHGFPFQVPRMRARAIIFVLGGVIPVWTLIPVAIPCTGSAGQSASRCRVLNRRGFALSLKPTS